MGQAGISRVTAYVAIAIMLAFLAGSQVLAADDDAVLNELALQLYSQGRYKEAAAAAEKAVALAYDTLGAEHPHTLIYVSNLGLMYKMLGRYTEAEMVYRRALKAGERVFGPEHRQTLTSANNLAALYEAQERYAEAEPIYKRALAGREHVLGPQHPNTLRTRNNLAGVYEGQGRYAEAELLYRSTMTAFERVLGANHPDTLMSVNKLAGLHRAQGRYSEARPLYRRALEGRERALGANHPNTLTSVNDLAFLYVDQGLYDEAEPLYRRALDARDQALGPDHPDTLVSVNNLAALFASQSRDTEAEPLYRRALDAAERVLGARHRVTLAAIDNLAQLYRKQGRYDDAERLHRRSLAIAEQLYGPDHPDMLVSINNLAAFHQAQGRHAEAEPLYRRTLALAERAIGAEHPRTLTAVNNLAVLYQLQRRHAEAEPLYRRAVDARERVLGPDHPDTVSSLSNLATLYLLQRNWSQAAHYWKRSTAAIVARTRRGASDVGGAVLGKRRSDAEQASFQFAGLVRVAHRLASAGGTPDAASSRAMFQTAQWALSSEAAQSLAQMAARGTKGDAKLAALVRERQDLVAEWQRREVLRNASLGLEAAKRKSEAEAENHGRMAGIDRRLVEIDAKLVAEFPDYASLASPAPLAVDEVQALLGANEALVLFLGTAEWQTMPGETFIWVVTANDVRWVRSDLGSETLSRDVQALRCGLDAAAWAEARCTELTGRSHPIRRLPFDHARAHVLYKALFGQVEELIKGKHLLIVPSGALTQLPFQVLVTAPPVDDNHKSAAWLIRDHALTVLPAVSSLKALRHVSKPSAATKPLIGFGNPLLDGPDSTYAEYARLARDKQSCPKTIWQRVTEFFRIRGGVHPIELRRGLADMSKLRMLAPLPETADELCAVAHDLGADANEIRLGVRATEHEVKARSRSGELAQYGIVHFATHGAMAGELDGSSEPGLILTPPARASEEDDGYLSASEIAGLRLDADWVILSACNTAAGAAANADALSGLARAFIYAQARALLVSHWAVDSNATVKLITAAMREIGRDRTVARAEALRRAMLAMIDKGATQEAHPAYWAPFILVGEGGR